MLVPSFWLLLCLSELQPSQSGQCLGKARESKSVMDASVATKITEVATSNAMHNPNLAAELFLHVTDEPGA